MDAHCVDCGLPVSSDRIDWNDGKARCVDCKKKSLGKDEPRELTEQEVRERFLKHVWSIIGYWLTEERVPEPLEKMAGVAFSILGVLDGSAAALPSFIVAPVGHPDNEGYHRERLENWFPHNGDDVQKIVKCDISGGLHDQFEKHRPESLPKNAPVQDSGHIRPPSAQTPLETFGLVRMYQVLEHLKKTTAEFAVRAWKPIQDYVAASKGKFHSALFGDVKMMIAVLPEMVTVTFARNGKSLSLIGPSKSLNGPEANCGIHTIWATADEARDMVTTVLERWDPARIGLDEDLMAAWKIKKDTDDQLYGKS